MNREEMIAALYAEYPGMAQEVEQYIGEAEHQDGEGYWENFETLADLFTDFDLWIAALDEL